MKGISRMKWLGGIRAPIVAMSLAFFGVPNGSAAQAPRFQLELEAGPVWQSRNDVEIPNDGTATRFSLSDVAGTGAWPAARIYLTWQFSESQSVRLLYAPLSVTETGTLQAPTDFAGSRYAGGSEVEATYKFNSYRASYRWRFHAGAQSSAWVGLTAKIRDASIALSQGSVTSTKDDVGFVPLIHIAVSRTVGPGWHLAFDADALAGGPGRAIDATLKAGYDLGERWSLRAGYRTVEGGADVESVYNFAWLHYGAVSILWRL
ncbi:MAG: hypothetical protein OEN56_05925 [Gemmatimonadota bacterium]|nr:hypothetical protein [Gemmatimonadota bacterium]